MRSRAYVFAQKKLNIMITVGNVCSLVLIFAFNFYLLYSRHFVVLLQGCICFTAHLWFCLMLVYPVLENRTRKLRIIIIIIIVVTGNIQRSTKFSFNVYILYIVSANTYIIFVPYLCTIRSEAVASRLISSGHN